jgi:N-acetyl-gamma-glutamylphosphate reductase
VIEAWSGDPAVRRLLAAHPRVDKVEPSEDSGIRFQVGGRVREVDRGNPKAEAFGLLELMDNNPIVCADMVSVPSAAGTLALIALGPLAATGLIRERPVVVSSFDLEESDLAASLTSVGWTEGADVHVESQEIGSVLVLTAIAVVPTSEHPADYFDLYQERFGGSFFVRQATESDWSPSLVSGLPFAAYRLSLVPDEPNSLITIRTMADRDGKCGAAQLVHALNVMCGFDDALGIA